MRLNLAVLRQLPVLPGARYTATHSSAYYPQDNEHAPPAGDTTIFTYAAPSGAAARDVVSFYGTKLRPDWSCRRERFRVQSLDQSKANPNAIVNLTCSRGATKLTVDTANMPRTFDIGADSPR